MTCPLLHAPIGAGCGFDPVSGRDARPPDRSHGFHSDVEGHWCPVCQPCAGRLPASRTRDSLESHPFGLAPIPANTRMVSGIKPGPWDRKGQSIDGEGEASNPWTLSNSCNRHGPCAKTVHRFARSLSACGADRLCPPTRDDGVAKRRSGFGRDCLPLSLCPFIPPWANHRTEAKTPEEATRGHEGTGEDRFWNRSYEGK